MSESPAQYPAESPDSSSTESSTPAPAVNSLMDFAKSASL